MEPATLLKLTLLHGCFSRFLNCTNGTKSRNAPHIKASFREDVGKFISNIRLLKKANFVSAKLIAQMKRSLMHKSWNLLVVPVTWTNVNVYSTKKRYYGFCNMREKTCATQQWCHQHINAIFKILSWYKSISLVNLVVAAAVNFKEQFLRSYVIILLWYF